MTFTHEDFYQNSERSRRISVDVDSLQEDPLKVLRIFFLLKNIFPETVVSVKRTLHGFHVKAVGEPIKQIPITKRIDIREVLGDDWRRIEYERKKVEWGLSYFVDTLFSIKQKKRIVGREEDTDPVALPWASKIPAQNKRRGNSNG